MSQNICLKWDEHISIIKEFKEFLTVEAMVDVTLACDGRYLKAHKLILSACSPFFKSLFLENPCTHPIVILKDVKYIDLQAILQFIYHGRVNVTQDRVLSLINTAAALKVKGLGEVQSQDNLSDCELEDPSADEFNADSSHQSVCLIDCVTNIESTQQQSLYDQSDNEVYKPEIKQEIPDDIISNTVTVPSVSHNSNDFILEEKSPTAESYCENFPVEQNSQDFTPNFHGQISTTNILTKDSSVQSNTELHKNYSNGMTSSVPVVQRLKFSDAPVTCDQQSNVSSDHTGATPPQEEFADIEPQPSTSSTLTLAEREVLDVQKENEDDDETLTLAEREVLDMQEENEDDDENNISMYSSDEVDQNGKVKRRSRMRYCKRLQNKRKLTPRLIAILKRKREKQAVINNNKLNAMKDKVKTIKSKRSVITRREVEPFSAEEFKKHAAIEHDRKRKFHCDQCSYASNHKANLVRHVAGIHLKEKPFACSLCPLKCTGHYELKRHYQRVHVPKKLLKCEECNFNAFQKTTLIKHMANVHKKKEEFACTLCNYRSARKEAVVRHWKIHTNEKISVLTAKSNKLMTFDRLQNINR